MDFARRYPYKILPLLRERNLGAHQNSKEALSACRGEYVALLEGDDYWVRDDKLQRQVDFLDEHPDHNVCCARAQFVDETGATQSSIYPATPSGSYTIVDLLEANLVVTCTVMYRWGLVGSLPDWFRTLKMTDWPLHILVARSGKIRLMDEIVSVYRVHPGGAWSSLSHIDQLSATTQMLRALDKHLELQYTDTIRRVVGRRYIEMAQTARNIGSRTETARHLLSYARYGAWQPGNRRLLAGLAAYTLIGSWYKLFSRAEQANPN